MRPGAAVPPASPTTMFIVSTALLPLEKFGPHPLPLGVTVAAQGVTHSTTPDDRVDRGSVGNVPKDGLNHFREHMALG